MTRDWAKTIDWKIVICFLALCIIGCLSIYSATTSGDGTSILDPATRSGKQILWVGVSLLVGGAIIFLINAHVWEAISFPAYILVILLLVFVLLFGSTVNGSRSWFQMGALSFQPSELSKITTALLLSHLLRSINPSRAKLRDMLSLAACLILPAFFILLEGETGSILVYVCFLFTLYREGMSGWILVFIAGIIAVFILTLLLPLWASLTIAVALVGLFHLVMRGSMVRRLSQKRKLYRYCILLLLLGVAVVFSTNFVFERVLKPYQKNRIEVLLGIKEDLAGVGYNVNQSMIAIGSGGFAGKGFTNGTQTALGFVPEQSTDFIFCTIGEEAGFLGCLAVILLYVFLTYRLIVDANECRDPFSRAYGFCVAGCIFMHMAINIGMTIGLMPVIGIPLPFISYGGTSLLSFTVMIAIFLALVRQEKKYF